MNVKIVGDGAFGNAMYSVVSHNCADVTILKRGDRITDFDALIISVPTQAIREVLAGVQFTRDHIVINTAKGIEKSTLLLPHQIVSETANIQPDYYSLIGPSFAEEVSAQMPTLVNIGFNRKGSNNQAVMDLFQTNYFRVKSTAGVEVLELSAAFKNIYAIGCGLVDGLGFGTNTRVKMLVLAIEELSSLITTLHMMAGDDITAGTTGDLILTCNSITSRNYRFGKLLATHSVADALVKVHSTVEGYHSLSSVDHFKRRSQSPLSLAAFISDVVQSDDQSVVRRRFMDFVRTV